MRAMPAVLTFIVLLISCSKGPSTTPLTLASGKVIRLLSVGPVRLGNGSTVLMARYESSLSISDSPPLRAEAADVFDSVRAQAEKSGLHDVIISANSPSTGIISKGSAFNFAFKQLLGGEWDSPSGPKVVTKLKFGKMALVNGRLDVSEETTDIPLLNGGMKSMNEFQNIFGPCIEYQSPSREIGSWVVVHAPSGNPLPPGVELQDGGIKILLESSTRNGFVCQYNYFTPGDLPGDWTYDVYFGGELVKSWTAHVTQPVAR